MDPAYIREYENFERRHWWFVARRRIILAAIDRYVPGAAQGKGRWLDIGCGAGVLLESYTGFAQKLGAELDAGCVARTSESKIDVRQIEPKWDFSELGSFDCVSLCDVLEHVENEREALDAAAGALKEDGILLITVPALMSLWSNHDVVNHHFRRYRREQIISLFPPEKWEIKKASYFCTFLFPLIWAVRKAKNLIRPTSANPAAVEHDLKFGFPVIDRMLGGIFSLEKPVLERMNFPIGSSILLVVRKKRAGEVEG